MISATRGIDRRILTRLGMASFAFFLMKGLAWLAIPLVMYLMGSAG